jgi:Na+/proline symporter
MTAMTAFFAGIFALGVFAANILIALGVHRDALQRNDAGRKGSILSPAVWGWVCLFLSFPGLALYWAAHYSTFAKDSE